MVTPFQCLSAPQKKEGLRDSSRHRTLKLKLYSRLFNEVQLNYVPQRLSLFIDLFELMTPNPASIDLKLLLEKVMAFREGYRNKECFKSFNFHPPSETTIALLGSIKP